MGACFRQRESGFTLIELMIAVAIVGLLMSAAIPIFRHYLDKAKNVEAIENTAALKSSMKAYYGVYERAPVHTCNDPNSGLNNGPCSGNYQVPAASMTSVCGGQYYPDAVIDEFNSTAVNNMFRNVNWSPEGRIRFRYYGLVTATTLANRVRTTGGQISGGRAISCDTSHPEMFVFIGYIILPDEQNLTFRGPLEYYAAGSACPGC